MADQSHHHHHSHHLATSSSSTENSTIVTTMATILQNVLTTVMPDDHHSAMSDASHAGISDHQKHTMDTVTTHSVHVATHANGMADEDHMLMYFHTGIKQVVLFKEWNITTTQGLIASVFGIFFMAMLYEGIKFYREHMFKRYFTSLDYSSVSVVSDDGKTVMEVHKVARNRILSWPHALQTVLHVVQMVLSYFLMLIFMTYNVWLCLGVVLGAGTGYFLFGWRKATVVDITEHCN